MYYVIGQVENYEADLCNCKRKNQGDCIEKQGVE